MKTQHGIALFAALTLALTACGGPSTPDVASMSLTGSSSVAVGAASQVTATPKDASGNAISTSVTYTSDQPNVIAVDNSGNLTVRRLTATDKPVTITASAGGKSATLQVTTYGLELALGTYNSTTRTAANQPGLAVAVRFRTQSGNMDKSTINILAPSGKTFTDDLPGGDPSDYDYWWASSITDYPNGEYVATITQKGVTYTAKASINDRTNLLGVLINASATVSGRQVTYNAIPRAESKRFIGRLFDLNGDWADGLQSNALPFTSTLASTFNAGDYNAWLYALNINLNDYTQILPDQFKVSANFIGKVTVK